MEGNFLLCEVEGHPKHTEEEKRPLQATLAQKTSTVTRVESAEAQDSVSSGLRRKMKK